jgi:hypothetical protein
MVTAVEDGLCFGERESVRMNPRGALVVATGFLAALGVGPAALAGDTGLGVIAGKISFEGSPPPSRKVKLTADPKCAAVHPGGLEVQHVKVTGGGLAEVLVHVKSGISGSYPAPSEPALLDQVGCQYQPRMVAIMVGQPLKLRNSDDTLHNIHPRPTANKEFNAGQPRKGMENTKTFDTPELMIPTGCDVHPWMRAYISVLSNPFFAVTREDGSYEIKGLPDGDYEVDAVHAELGKASGKVSVKQGQMSRLDLALKAQ